MAVIGRRNLISLIINGDDFGYSLAVNRGVVDAYQRGVLTSASLMVNEAATEHAVRLAHENPGLAVGLHLSLVLGRAALPPSEIPHIADRDGYFSRSPLRAGLKYFFNRDARREVKLEMRRQFEAFRATGLRFSHVDGHNHLHMHPVVFDELITLCEEFDVKRVRIVGGDSRTHFEITRANWPAKFLLSSVFRVLGRACSQRLRGRGFTVPPVVYGLLQSGSLDEDYLLKLLRRIDRRGGEIYLHPRTGDASEAECQENSGGERELSALLSPRVRELIESRPIRLATYETYWAKQNA